MKFIKEIKTNRGVSLADVAVAIILISIMLTTMGNMFYQVYYNMGKVRLNAIAMYYAVNILEDTDRFAYEEVDNDFLTKNDYNLQENFEATINVEKYSDQYPEKEDIIKIVTLTINYTYQGTQEELTLKKLKIKEI